MVRRLLRHRGAPLPKSRTVYSVRVVLGTTSLNHGGIDQETLSKPNSFRPAGSEHGFRHYDLQYRVVCTMV